MTTIDQPHTIQPLSQAQAQTPIEDCVQEEMATYFQLLDGQSPHNLYRLVMNQAEEALITTVLDECNGNQSKAAMYLGLSRGTLRSKMVSYGCIDKQVARSSS